MFHRFLLRLESRAEAGYAPFAVGAGGIGAGFGAYEGVKRSVDLGHGYYWRPAAYGVLGTGAGILAGLYWPYIVGGVIVIDGVQSLRRSSGRQ